MSPIRASFRTTRPGRSARGYAASLTTRPDRPVGYTEIRALPRDLACDRDRGHHRAGGGDVDAGDRHQPADLGRVDGVLRDLPVGELELALQEVELTQAGLDRLALVDGQLELGKPSPAARAEQVADRPALE